MKQKKISKKKKKKSIKNDKKKCGILFSTMNNFGYANYFCQDKKQWELFLNKEMEKKQQRKKIIQINK